MFELRLPVVKKDFADPITIINILYNNMLIKNYGEEFSEMYDNYKEAVKYFQIIFLYLQKHGFFFQTLFNNLLFDTFPLEKKFSSEPVCLSVVSWSVLTS